jgi:hypothetical protein
MHYTTQNNGKTERLINTLVNKWAYSLSLECLGERYRWISSYLTRKHRSCNDMATYVR